MRNLCLFTISSTALLSLYATAAPADRVIGPIDAADSVTLADHVRTYRGSYVDEGLVNPTQRMRLTMFLKASPAQKTALDQLLIDLQDPASSTYHQWLTPEEFADRFAISAADADRITDWLQSQGFQIGWVGRGRSVIVFSGTAGAVDASFHADLHRYRFAKAVHYSNAQNPSVPKALEGVVRRIGGLDDFLPEHSPHPEYTASNGTHSLGPDDLAILYDFATLIANGIDGTGQKIVVTGESDILASDFQAYRARYNLPTPNVQPILVPGSRDPGLGTTNDDLLEADIDVELAGGVARNATVLYVYSESAYDSLTYAVDQALAPVITVSYHLGCDASVAPSELFSYQQIAQQANAEGITWINSSGDIGAAGCDNNGEKVATLGLATRFPADIPEVTGVGGTELSTNTSYWSGNNGPHGGSILSYVPETVWNTTTASGIEASNGGVSTFFPKPPWQTGPGVPNDGQRETPDVAVSAGGTIPYLINTNGTVVNQGATSSAAPVFAGMVVLLNQYLVANGAQTKPGLGNLNTLLYRIAQSNPSAFHDILSGNNIVPCTPGSPDCVNGQLGYSAGPGYDLCTGLGSVDLAKLAAAAIPEPVPASLIVVSSNADPVYQHAPVNGSSWNVSLTLTEEGGVPTTLTAFSIDGKSEPLSNFFTADAINAFGAVKTTINFADLKIPETHTFAFTGSDAGGRSWTASVTIPFLGFSPSSGGPTPAITGTTNGASFQQAYAPGMILSIFGSNLGSGIEAAGGVPLLTYMQAFEATVNGVLAPIYYVSPTQANVQIPYGTAPGAAQLVVYQGGQSAAAQIQIAASALGIFADANGNTVPYPSGSADQALVLFITGDGEVSPALATGSAPSPSTPIASLPKSVLPVSMTIGGQPAQILFDGIPSGLVGVTQINFVVPHGLPPGPQPVVITVGTASSKPATFTITTGS